MATTNKRLISGSQLTASAATYYTAPASTRCVIKRLTLCNTTAGALTATIYLVASGGSAGDASTLVKTRTIAAGETWDCACAEGHVLEAGGTIQALASSATSITLMASGVEIT